MDLKTGWSLYAREIFQLTHPCTHVLENIPISPWKKKKLKPDFLLFIFAICSTREEAEPECNSLFTCLCYQLSTHIFSNMDASQRQWELISWLPYRELVLCFIVHSLSPRGDDNSHEFSSPLFRAGIQVITSHIDVSSQVMWISHIYLDSKPLQHKSLKNPKRGQFLQPANLKSIDSK